MLRIRLQRVGRKHEPTFRVVLTDSRNSTKSGRFLEVLGSYDPRGKREVAFKKERVLHWLSFGAKATGTVYNLLVAHGVVAGKKVHVSPNQKAVLKREEGESTIKKEMQKSGETPSETAEAKGSGEEAEKKEETVNA